MKINLGKHILYGNFENELNINFWINVKKIEKINENRKKLFWKFGKNDNLEKMKFLENLIRIFGEKNVLYIYRKFST